MRERKRKHDDAHYPLQGKGKRATKTKTKPSGPMCTCGAFREGSVHLCSNMVSRSPKDIATKLDDSLQAHRDFINELRERIDYSDYQELLQTMSQFHKLVKVYQGI